MLSVRTRGGAGYRPLGLPIALRLARRLRQQLGNAGNSTFRVDTSGRRYEPVGGADDPDRQRADVRDADRRLVDECRTRRETARHRFRTWTHLK